MYGAIRHAGYIANRKERNRALDRQNPVASRLVGYPKSLLDK